jgi:hypothetical protein
MTRLKLDELTSGVGALVLGAGLGALASPWIGSAATRLALTGLALHAFGMWDKHRMESADHAHNPPWVVASYWLCWLLLAVVLAMLLV